MAAWVLRCLSCNLDFIHSKIADYTLNEFLNSAKPTFAPDGIDLACSNCGVIGRYLRTDLIYRAA